MWHFMKLKAIQASLERQRDAKEEFGEIKRSQSLRSLAAFVKEFGPCPGVTGESLKSFKQENNKIKFAFKKPYTG